ncbi:hypothetical protein SAMD00023353_0400200 [Rosellinia necatrix]|uniref:Uncharacterized protein n=1 Tax=Rosellinia necatrix TaxID=77044 RepID=A0A1S8A5C7_ROSNE|nr:hypothetical protein SAMD00023353_0400200 [Rosellinia necatrix]
MEKHCICIIQRLQLSNFVVGSLLVPTSFLLKPAPGPLCEKHGYKPYARVGQTAGSALQFRNRQADD